MSRNSLVDNTDFPLLSRRIEDRPIVYLDSAATALKPRSVIDSVRQFYEQCSANVHRGDHTLSQEVSGAFEAARDSVARFINATGREIIFTANTTESLNLVAGSLELAPGDNVVTSILDHHSNILPWMNRCEVRFLPEGADGVVDVSALARLVDGRTRLITMCHASNVTGAINPVAEAIAFARERGIPVALDGAQSVPHLPIDVAALGCDFLAFSGHKLLGPSGVGVLYASERVWPRMQPLKLGGGMVKFVRQDGFDLKRIPHRFEAGTPNIEGILGLAAAIDYLERLGMDRVAAHDAALARHMSERFAGMAGVSLLGPTDAHRKIGIATLVPVDKTIDVGILGHLLSDSYKVMVRSGTHCAHPYYESRHLPGALRLSAYVYTSEDDIDVAAGAIEALLHRLGARRG